MTLISWPMWISLHRQTCDSQTCARLLRASGLTLFPHEPSAHFNNPACNKAKMMVLIFMHEVFALQQGGGGGGGGVPAEDVWYLLFGWILRSPLFHNIRGFGDALGLQSRDTSFPSVAITQTGLSTKTGAEAKKGHTVNSLQYLNTLQSLLYIGSCFEGASSEWHWQQYYHTWPEPAVKTSYNCKESTTDEDWSP